MAVKKKTTKSSGKAKTSKIVAKIRSSAKKSSGTRKGATPVNTVKGKKASTSKQSKAKSAKPPSSTKKAITASPSKKKKTAASSPVKKKKVTVSKPRTTRKVSPAKTRAARKTVKPKRAQPTKTITTSKGLSQLPSSERYNVGGLCACVIETFTKEGQGRLQRVLTHLGLSGMEQSNLFRVSQGLRIPKLFSDGLADEETRRRVLQGLSQFAKADDPSGKSWKSDLEDFARLLGA